MAPEVLNNEKGRLDSDIFSLHVVMWEVSPEANGQLSSCFYDPLRVPRCEEIWLLMRLLGVVHV